VAPAPRPLTGPYGILVTGIGGTGVITVGALVAMAAHLEGKGCTALDFTGLAQKNGAVMSHVRIAPAPEDLHSVRLAPGGADLVLGCDMVVAASPAALSRMEHGVTHAIVNSDLQPTAAFVMDGDVDFEARTMERALRAVAGDAKLDLIDATGLATALMGDSIATNLFMLGYAFQKGLVPLGLAALERAIELNGVAVESNKHAFGWGRLAAQDHATLERFLRPQHPAEAPHKQGLAALVERRAKFLADYQDEAYARRYRAFVAAVAEAEKARVRGHGELAETVARGLFKLMAYKDEYEVARLYTDGTFRAKLDRAFEGNYRLEFHLAPPLLAARDPATGHLTKGSYGPWMLHAFALLKRFKFLRGSKFDPFGRSAERRMERQLIVDYERTVRELIDGLAPENHALAVEIAHLPELIRGFGHIKDRNLAEAKAREAALLASFRTPLPAATAAE
jgi:indolepyruvate ferredoxin oxidoreductase